MQLRMFVAVSVWLTVASAVFSGTQDVVTTPEGRKLEFDPDWTPRPQEGDVPAYVKETDVDWVDDRLQQMDTGRTFNATFKYRHNGKDVTCHKGTAIRVGERGEAAWLYDRNQLRWCCAWECEPLTEPTPENPTGFTPYLNHSDRRFGLLNTPTPRGTTICSTATGLNWTAADDRWPAPPAMTLPTSVGLGRHAGITRIGNRTVVASQFPEADDSAKLGLVFEHPWATKVDGRIVLTREVEYLGGDGRRFRMWTPDGSVRRKTVMAHDGDASGLVTVIRFEGTGDPAWVALFIPADNAGTMAVDALQDNLTVRIGGPHSRALLCVSHDSSWTVDEFFNAALQLGRTEMHANGLSEWLGAAIDVRRDVDLESEAARSPDTAAYVIDTLTLPYENPYRALMFCSGVEFVPRSHAAIWATGDGPDLVAVSTVHGDVWLVDGVDEDLGTLRWRRFATGLYQPLGLKFVSGGLVVLERGQLTRLHDHNRDGIADEYACICGDWHIGGGEHSYHTSLETDLDGNFYFHVGGDTNTPTGGTLIKVPADGSRSEVFCTGFRHPIGLGSLPDGRITGADQEGNWMPSTRLDIYQQRGFYGDMRAHHREVAPITYDGPLCWIPRQVDGSAGGQVFVDRDDFGPLSGHLLHMSFGNCSLMQVLRQAHAGIEQAGVFDLGLRFLAGIQRGRFRASDGCLYLAGMDGWQTAAQADGCLQRVRYTGQPFAIPTGLTAENGGFKLQFNVPITSDYADADALPKLPASAGEAGNFSHVAADPQRYNVEVWNYLWSKEYGSQRYSVAHPGEAGQDRLKVESATILDPWTVFLKVPQLRPCMQAQIEYDLLAYADDVSTGEQLKGTIHSTIHTTGPALEFQHGDRVALVGGTLIERAQRYGYWEHAITAAHPGKRITFRNLGWSGDTVWADSRGIFDPADKGYARLVEQVQELRPSLFLLNYGGNEAWESLQRGEPAEAAIAKFITQYGKLIDDMTVASRGQPAPAGNAPGQTLPEPRFVLLTPLPLEAGVGPNKDPARYNDHLAQYTAAIENLARDRGVPCVNLADVYPWYAKQSADVDQPRPLTDNGVHLSEYGYWRTAAWIRERLCAGTSAPSIVLPTAQDATDVLTRFDKESGRIKIDLLPANDLKRDTPCLEFGGHVSVLPQPQLDGAVGESPRQRYLLLSPGSYRMEVDDAVASRGADTDWFEGVSIAGGPDEEQSRELLTAIRRKNELYFHRWRPQNITYLFLFRKHEQGNNAVEIPQFDPLIEAEEARITELRQPPRRTFRLVRESDK